MPHFGVVSCRTVHTVRCNSSGVVMARSADIGAISARNAVNTRCSIAMAGWPVISVYARGSSTVKANWNSTATSPSVAGTSCGGKDRTCSPRSTMARTRSRTGTRKWRPGPSTVWNRRPARLCIPVSRSITAAPPSGTETIALTTVMITNRASNATTTAAVMLMRSPGSRFGGDDRGRPGDLDDGDRRARLDRRMVRGHAARRPDVAADLHLPGLMVHSGQYNRPPADQRVGVHPDVRPGEEAALERGAHQDEHADRRQREHGDVDDRVPGEHLGPRSEQRPGAEHDQHEVPGEHFGDHQSDADDQPDQGYCHGSMLSDRAGSHRGSDPAW